LPKKVNNFDYAEVFDFRLDFCGLNDKITKLFPMDRKEFLAMFGISSAAFAIATCLNSCGKAQVTNTAPTVNFTMDLTQPSNAALQTNGGFLYVQGLIVARTNAGAFIAVSQACTHQGTSVVYQASASDFVCPAHGSTFAPNGAVGMGPATVSLKSYYTSLSGNILHISG
jgi:cytochrome b6-f complex iron-sulfur subunit